MDLFMANDLSANHLWLNLKNGKFEENALQVGTAYGSDGISKTGRGAAAGDYDNDGDDDLLVVNGMQEGASFFRNDGSKGFADISDASGVYAATLPWSGFGLVWQDFDRDGWLDLFVANGAISKTYEQKSLLLRNPAKPGEKFELISFDIPAAIGRSAAYGDIDNDGDIDVLMNVNHGKARLLLNETAKRNWVAVQVDGPGMGEGAQVVVKATGMPVQTRTLRTGGGYLSASDARVYFGLGSSDSIESISLTSPGKPAVVQNKPTVNTVVRFTTKP